jgi:hypothetical protein
VAQIKLEAFPFTRYGGALWRHYGDGIMVTGALTPK